jgi:transposase
MLADEVDYVVGVDTHRDRHALAVVAAPTGAVVAQRSVQTDASGYSEAVRFAERYAAGVRVWAVEGAGHYGAGLARQLAARGETVLESGRPARVERRLKGKDDSLDAIRAARTVLGGEQRTLPRAGQRQEALRVLLLARRSAVDVRRLALVQLRSVIVTAPSGLRDELRLLPVGQLIRRCSRFRRSTSRTPDELAIVLVLRSLAQRIEAATEEAALLELEILKHVRALVPELLNEAGVGPIVAAQLIVTWSHRERVRSEAAFARLAGVAPLPASSGQTIRHRLSRGGDRQLNRALHTIVLHRRQHDPATRDYIARRIAEGKSSRDAVRAPQALPRPPPLPRHAERHARDDLTVIGDSLRKTGPGELLSS